MMLCPKCRGVMRVYTTRSFDTTIKRTRECEDCGHRFWTWEIINDEAEEGRNAEATA